jgi:hypothetical protein
MCSADYDTIVSNAPIATPGEDSRRLLPNNASQEFCGNYESINVVRAPVGRQDNCVYVGLSRLTNRICQPGKADAHRPPIVSF